MNFICQIAIIMAWNIMKIKDCIRGSLIMYPPIKVGNDWYSCYKAIYVSNAVLDNLETYHIMGAENVKRSGVSTACYTLSGCSADMVCSL